MLIKSYEEICAAINQYNYREALKPRDRGYVQMPFPETAEYSVTEGWMLICRVFSIINKPTLAERNSAKATAKAKLSESHWQYVSSEIIRIESIYFRRLN